MNTAKAVIDPTGDQRTFHWKMAPELHLQAGSGMHMLEKVKRCEEDGQEGGQGHSRTTNRISEIPSSSSGVQRAQVIRDSIPESSMLI